MASYNRVILLGNITRDPEVRYLRSGKAVTDLGLAVSTKYRSQDGTQHEDVCFVTCVVYGKQAENCGKYLTRGRQVLVDGRLHYEQWEKDGQKRSTLKVVADRVQFLGGPGGESADEDVGSPTAAAHVGEQGREEPRGGAEPSEKNGSEEAADSDDVPF